MKQLLLTAAILLLSGCVGGGGEKIKDFTNRSTAYAWVNIDDVDGNHLYHAYVKQYRPKTNAPNYSLRIKEFKDGFLLYTNAVTNGAFKLDKISAQSCFGLCSSTYYTYSFGSQGGDIGTATIKQPGVYYLGSYDLIEENTGIFEQSKFNVTKAAKPPSKNEMLEVILADAPKDHPVVGKRIRKALSK